MKNAPCSLEEGGVISQEACCYILVMLPPWLGSWAKRFQVRSGFSVGLGLAVLTCLDCQILSGGFLVVVSAKLSPAVCRDACVQVVRLWPMQDQ
eukprot:2042257-Amphidinium_carterae.2